MKGIRYSNSSNYVDDNFVEDGKALTKLHAPLLTEIYIQWNSKEPQEVDYGWLAKMEAKEIK